MLVRAMYAAVFVAAAATGVPMTDEIDTPVIVDFGADEGSSWRAVNDGVMGGVSEGRLRPTGEGTAVFEGRVSLENNGGFASVRAPVRPGILGASEGLRARVRGDGRRYQLRLRTDGRFDGVAYRATFETRDGEWQDVEVPFASFVPTFRGRRLPDAPSLDPAKIRQLGFLVADGQGGSFRLEIERVSAYGPR